MFHCLQRTGRTRVRGQKKLLGALSAKTMLLYTPVLRWYIVHGLVIKIVHRSIDYKAKTIFEWFAERVTEARRQGDADKPKAILADVFTLLGNSCYSKFIEALKRQTQTDYTKDETVVDRALRSSWFVDLEEIGEAYEINKRKPRIQINRPFQIRIAVYQLAKLRMLEFYYDFLDVFVSRRDGEPIQMDTDSNYLAISGENIEKVVGPELHEKFETCRKQRLAWDKWSGRTPGLFKLAFVIDGDRVIALCSKAYYVDGERSEGKRKHSAKGMSARHNDLTWRRYKAALEGKLDRAENGGFRRLNDAMKTYHQEKLSMSAYYDKRRVLLDGIYTEPLEYALR